ncbi:hypothetical protein [Xanthomonas euvesicatoria]|uniref:hypothetical protein n=1 Tax=Xanthomonas euvesicatoria TaxID=456327 RepID=UPI001E2C5B78|nr:hypothetical protein [Xanthomonas euvesicatoria]MCC8614622.1 hypothetical protein [Xanthomonas euvesicatoria pv. euvesicatoria]
MSFNPPNREEAEMTKSPVKSPIWPSIAYFAGLIVKTFFWVIMAQLIAKTYSPELGRGIISILLVGFTVFVSNRIEAATRKASAHLAARNGDVRPEVAH